MIGLYVLNSITLLITLCILGIGVHLLMKEKPIFECVIDDCEHCEDMREHYNNHTYYGP